MSKAQKLEDKQILTKLAKDFHDLITNKEVLRPSVESFLNNVIDELTLGIIFNLHRKYKTRSYEIDMDEDDGDEDENAEIDVFAQHDIKKTQDCVCPICDRAVAAIKFAPHLEVCMGMGRRSTRNATRSVATSSNSKDTSFSGVPSDDEDDIDWNSGNKRGKKKKRNNGNKKSKTSGTPKKSGDSKSIETSNVEIEAEDDELSSLRDLLQDHSNSSSPADSISSMQSNSSKQKEKSRSKKNKRDRSSPSSSISAD